MSVVLVDAETLVAVDLALALAADVLDGTVVATVDESVELAGELCRARSGVLEALGEVAA